MKPFRGFKIACPLSVAIYRDTHTHTSVTLYYLEKCVTLDAWFIIKNLNSLKSCGKVKVFQLALYFIASPNSHPCFQYNIICLLFFSIQIYICVSS